MERESMQFDVVIVGAGPAGLAAAIRHPPAQHGARSGDHGLRDRQGLGARRAHAFRRGARAARARRAAAGLARRRRAAQHAGRPRTASCCSAPTRAIRLPTPPQMHNAGNYIVSMGNVVKLAGRAGRGARRRDLPGLRRGRGAVPRGRQRQGGRDRRHGDRPRRPAEGQLRARASSCTPPTRCSPRAAAAR